MTMPTITAENAGHSRKVEAAKASIAIKMIARPHQCQKETSQSQATKSSIGTAPPRTITGRFSARTAVR